MSLPEIIVRIKSISIGVSENDCYEWVGIRAMEWGDVSPWVHIDIPSGLMVHQHILSPHVRGQIKCYDFNSLYTALFQTIIDANNHTAVKTDSTRKYNIDWFKVNMVTKTKEVLNVIFDGVKIETIGIELMELGKEMLWVVTFTADRVYYSV